AASSQEAAIRAARTAAAQQQMSAVEVSMLVAFSPLEPLLSSWSDDKAIALFERFVANHTWQTPTLELYRVWADALSGESSFWDDPELKLFPKAWVDSWRPERHKFLVGMGSSERVTLASRTKQWYRAQLDLVRRMHGAGVGFLAGTDASQWNFMVPGI